MTLRNTAGPGVPTSPATIYTVLGAAARRASVTRLVVLALIGGLGAAACGAFARRGDPTWVSGACLAAALACFGAWGLLDRRAAARDNGARLAIAGRALAAIGTVAAVVMALALAMALFTGHASSPYNVR